MNYKCEVCTKIFQQDFTNNEVFLKYETRQSCVSPVCFSKLVVKNAGKVWTKALEQASSSDVSV